MIRLSRFYVSVAASTAAATVLLALLLATNVALGFHLLPGLGIGGVYNFAEDVEAGNVTVYPEKNTYTSTSGGCAERPMVVFSFDKATLYGFVIRKDVQLPFLKDQWMVIEQIGRTEGGATPTITAEQLDVYTTQVFAEVQQADLLRLEEAQSQGNYQVFGPGSTEFHMEVIDQPGGLAHGMTGQNVSMWVHAMAGKRLVFNRNGHPDPITMNVSIQTTEEINNYYANKHGFDNPDQNPIGNVRSNRSHHRGKAGHNATERLYFECDKPSQD